MKIGRKYFYRVQGFMLIEVLIALALFGLSAVFLVDGAFVATRVIREMKDSREMEQDLLWARAQILDDCDSYEDIEEGGELMTLSLGEITWEAEVEMVAVVDLFLVKLSIEYDGNTDLGLEEGEWETKTLLFRPNWGRHKDFKEVREFLEIENREVLQEWEREQ